MKVLVTGGTGFIGRYLVEELLEHGYKVRVFARHAFKGDAESFIGDITDFESIKKAMKGIDAVFHNAAYAMDWGSKKEFYRVNVVGSENVAKACVENGIENLIYTSSAGVYGFPNSKEPITEESQKNPLNAYQKSKWQGEKAIEKYEINAAFIRPPLVLGAGGMATKIMLSSIENGRFSYIGSGNTFIPIVHPKDVAACMRLALEKNARGAFNVVSFHCRIKEFVEKLAELMNARKPNKHVSYGMAYAFAIISEGIAKITGKEPFLTRFRVKSLGTDRIISYERAMKLLGYKPSFDMEKTAMDMVNWYKNQ